MATVGACIDRRQPVVLITREETGRVVGTVDRPHRPRTTPRPGGAGVTLWQRFVEVNRPGPPEHSISFRTASVLAVLVGIGACWSEGELSPRVALVAVVATVVGNVVAYRHRANPWPGVKPVLAVCAVGGFVWFLLTVTHHATPGDISTVEAPLAVLFAWVLCTHAFDVPSRRDVAYSLAGSAALIAVAAAQSVNLTLGVWVVAWVVCCVWGLVAMWQSVSQTEGVPWRPVLGAGVLVAGGGGPAVGGAARTPGVRLADLHRRRRPAPGPVDSPSGLTDGSASLPAHAATASAAGPASADSSASPSRSTRPTGSRSATRWSCGSGPAGPTTGSARPSTTGPGSPGADRRTGRQPPLRQGDRRSPFIIPTYPDQVAPLSSGTQDVQTFYLAQGGPNLVFHADNAQRVYAPGPRPHRHPRRDHHSTASMGPGTIYTVVSDDTAACPAGAAAATAPAPATARPRWRPQAIRRRSGPLPPAAPTPYPQVAALAASITAGIGAPGDPDPHTYDKIAAIEAWMSDPRPLHHRHPAAAGRGRRRRLSFLFGSRRGYCEQISTATVVMLRSPRDPGPGGGRLRARLLQPDHRPLRRPGQGRPRLGPGLVPRLRLAELRPHRRRAAGQPDAPARSWPTALGHGLCPACPGSPSASWSSWSLVVVWWLRRRRARRPATWAHQVAADLARGGARLGLPRRPDETLTAYGQRLAAAAPDPPATCLAWSTSWWSGATTVGVEPVGRPDRRRPGVRPGSSGPGHGPVGAGRTGRPAGGSGGPRQERAVGQRLVERGTGGQQRPVAHELGRLAEGEHAAEQVPPAVEGDQLALLGPTLDHHHLVLGVGQADHLDLRRVLVRPEERDGVVGHGRRPMPARRLRAAAAPPSAALVQCSTRGWLARAWGGPSWPRPRRPPPGRRRTGTRRTPPRCRGSSPEPSSQPDRGDHADAHHHDVGGDPVSRRPGTTRPGPDRRDGRSRWSTRDPQCEVHAVGPVQIGHILRPSDRRAPGPRGVWHASRR